MAPHSVSNMTIASFVHFVEENKSKSRDDKSSIDGWLLNLVSRLQSHCEKPRIYFCSSCTSLPQIPARSSQSCSCNVLLTHPSIFTSSLLFLQSYIQSWIHTYEYLDKNVCFSFQVNVIGLWYVYRNGIWWLTHCSGGFTALSHALCTTQCNHCWRPLLLWRRVFT